MNRTHRLLRWSCQSVMSLALLVLLMAPMSHAQVSLDHVVTGTLDATQSAYSTDVCHPIHRKVATQST